MHYHRTFYFFCYFVLGTTSFTCCHWLLYFLLTSSSPRAPSIKTPSINCLRTETQVQLYCPVHGEHAVYAFAQSFFFNSPSSPLNILILPPSIHSGSSAAKFGSSEASAMRGKRGPSDSLINGCR